MHWENFIPVIPLQTFSDKVSETLLSQTESIIIKKKHEKEIPAQTRAYSASYKIATTKSKFISEENKNLSLNSKFIRNHQSYTSTPCSSRLSKIELQMDKTFKIKNHNTILLALHILHCNDNLSQHGSKTRKIIYIIQNHCIKTKSNNTKKEIEQGRKNILSIFWSWENLIIVFLGWKVC